MCLQGLRERRWAYEIGYRIAEDGITSRDLGDALVSSTLLLSDLGLLVVGQKRSVFWGEREGESRAPGEWGSYSLQVTRTQQKSRRLPPCSRWPNRAKSTVGSAGVLSSSLPCRFALGCFVHIPAPVASCCALTNNAPCVLQANAQALYEWIPLRPIGINLKISLSCCTLQFAADGTPLETTQPGSGERGCNSQAGLLRCSSPSENPPGLEQPNYMCNASNVILSHVNLDHGDLALLDTQDAA
ncbi:hypothetical protein N657DRAFT_315170 [Parathielavia appendiculata]|uniref:Uncharacterized protein n=1 Tax=Parathielavia appendiculata TaxID=2587402 RepID=A0AAN6U544_9PEZI|nr:hypothetical protein N657DRAFT_315170 [Parathielavia appendiculata]